MSRRVSEHDLRLPPHIAFSLEKDPHNVVYASLEDWLRDNDIQDDDWVSQEERDQAIVSGSVWIATWYPDTPLGHVILAAYSLAELLEGLRRAS